MPRYAYEGPVMEFDKCIQHCWKAETVASSEAKARSNLTFRFKKENNKIPQFKITLPGNIKTIS